MVRTCRSVCFVVSVVLATALMLPAVTASAEVSTPTVGGAVLPVLSPPLRDVPATAAVKDPGTPKDRRWLPYAALKPGVPPALQGDDSLQLIPGVNSPSPAGANFQGLNANGYAPPDSSGKIGPNHYVEWINVNFAIYDKSGTLLYGPAGGNSLFTSLGGPCATHNDGDPVVQYDQLADRWVLSQFVVGAPAPAFSHQCVAVSKTGDPLGAWYLYDFPTSATNFVDYPKWTTWTDAYYMTAHIFNAAGTAYLGPGLWSFDRVSMLAGLPAAFQSVNLDPAANMFGHLVADLDGLTPPPAGSPAYVFSPAAPEYDGTATPSLHFWTAASTWGASPTLTVTAKPDIATASYNTNLCGFSRNCIPQLGTTTTLDSLSGQLMFRATYRKVGANESILLSHTVNAAVPPANQAAVRWYEIRTPATTPTLYQQGTYAPTTANRWVPSIAMDEGGNIAVGYSISDATMYPGIKVAGRSAFDPPGTLGQEVTMFAGLGAQTGGLNRWGDYTEMTVDPRDGCTFWFINQYQPATGSFNWTTRIASYRFPNCVAPATGTLTGVVKDGAGNPIPNAQVNVDAGYSGATDATGTYTIVLPPGSYSMTATDPAAGCTPSASQAATVTTGGTTTRDFTLTGPADLAVKSYVIDDSTGNGNGYINRNECFKLNVDLSNDGCSGATGISASITTTTPGVDIVVGTAAYPDIIRGGHSPAAVPFSLATTSGFVCGTDIALTLTVTSSAGTQIRAVTLPTCSPTVVVTGGVTTSSPTEPGRLFRNGVASTCAGKACPGSSDTGNPHYYDTHSIANSASTSRCLTIIANTTGCAGSSMIHPSAYVTSYNPASLCTNFLGDSGSSPAPGPVTFSVNLPAGQPLVLVMQSVSAAAGFANCGAYSFTVSGLLDETDGGRPVASASGGGAICLGGSVGLTGSGGTSCLWSPATGLDDPNSCTPTASPTATTAYSVVVTNASGCVSDPSSPVTVTVNLPPTTPVITAPASALPGATGLTASVPLHAGSSYLWGITNGIITAGGTTNQITFTAGSPGSTILSVVETTIATGCSSSAGTATVYITNVEPAGLVEDAHANGGTTSNVNGVIEPGETVLVNPSWKNISASPVTLGGWASAFTGPAGATYTLLDVDGGYGTIAPGATADSWSAGLSSYRLSVSNPATRPAAHWDATFLETLSTGITKTWTLHVGSSFTDVPTSDVSYPFVENIFHNQITVGCAPGMFCPGDTTPRWQMAIFLARAILGPGVPIPTAGALPAPYDCSAGGNSLFTDVAPTDVGCPGIHYVYSQQVTVGCGGSLFCPNDLTPRWQMAVFLSRSMLGPGVPIPITGTVPAAYDCSTGGNSLFTDVAPTDVGCPGIHYIYSQAVTTGCGGGNFCPNDLTPRWQMAIFLVRAFHLPFLQ